MTRRLPVTYFEVFKLLKSMVPKSSPMDFIPTPLIVSCSDVFSHLIAHLANLSFAEGCFPSCFKSALVTPLLKKPELDTSNLSNFRPISNLNNISKILERLFLRVSRNTSLLLLTSAVISQLTAKGIPLKLLLSLHWIASSRLLIMVKPTSQCALTSVQLSTP